MTYVGNNTNPDNVEHEFEYTVRVIIPDGKNRQIIEETYMAFDYEKDVNNNLILRDYAHNVVIEFHNYNWLSIKPSASVV